MEFSFVAVCKRKELIKGLLLTMIAKKDINIVYDFITLNLIIIKKRSQNKNKKSNYYSVKYNPMS